MTAPNPGGAAAPGPRLPPRPSEHVRVRERRPVVVVTVPVEMPTLGVRGIAVKWDVEAHEHWVLTAPRAATPGTIALLLAALRVDDVEPVIRPSTMPAGATSVALLANGGFRTARGKRLAPWVLAEIGRVANVLELAHPDYLAAVAAALRGEGEQFVRPPADFVPSDPDRLMRIGPPPPAVTVDVSQSERVQFGAEPHQIMGADYQRNRYMADLSDAALSQRTADILGNLHHVNDAGLVALDAEDDGTPVWLTYMAEVSAELTLRHGQDPATWVPGLVSPSQLPGSLNPAALARHKPLRPATALPDRYVVKYSPRKFLEPAYHGQGTTLVKPASEYGDASMNVARRDEELATEVHFDPGPYAAFGRVGELLAEPGSRHTVRQELGTNYYVFCTAAALSSRLLLDFDADAALVIRDPDAYFARLDAAARRQLPGWRPLLTYVTYYDPLQVTPEEVQLIRWKHFRYAYQREVRMAWLPPSPVTGLNDLFLDLGPLTDIAELLV